MTKQPLGATVAMLLMISACGGASDEVSVTSSASTATSTTPTSSPAESDESADSTLDVEPTEDESSTVDVEPTEDESSAEDESPTEDESSETTETTSVEISQPTQPDLTVTVPDVAPLESSFEVIETGSGPTVGIGDAIFVAWEMIAIGTGEVVESTADDFGGPVPILIGEGGVPMALEEALDGQTVGSRLEVFFPAGMADLPEDLDKAQSYVLAVQIIDLYGSNS